eukprot:TRINITY_DN7536_c0_g1_i1.p1 TRINITY_DN7536_c0_g1~~TRINITY_DN7536_c0_g1_i1.p1  ORF type:complete len:339 (+),score=103.87 TRINITY_DN7536_c0_g1_i1:32-1048(+)
MSFEATDDVFGGDDLYGGLFKANLNISEEKKKPKTEIKKKKNKKGKNKKVEANKNENVVVEKLEKEQDVFTKREPVINDEEQQIEDKNVVVPSVDISTPVANKRIIRDKPKSKKLAEIDERLRGGRFRKLNDDLYNNPSNVSFQKFKDSQKFFDYHEGFALQSAKWPAHPLDKIIEFINELAQTNRNLIVADMGCGEARLSKTISSNVEKVHSFDFVAVNDTVTACDMAHVPLEDNSCDVVVFCLSLMGTNLSDFLLEASRILKRDGRLIVAEVNSRFESIGDFVHALRLFGFRIMSKKDLYSFFTIFFSEKQYSPSVSAINKAKQKLFLKACEYKSR